MRVPAIIYAIEHLIREIDGDGLHRPPYAVLPGIAQASYVMPDAQWGYGFPIGRVGDF